MANVLRPLMQWPRWHRHCHYRSALYHSPISTSPLLSDLPRINCYPLLLLNSSFSLSSYTHVRFRSHALKLPKVQLPSDSPDSDSDSSSDASSKKSRNEKKREAKRAVKSAMELADFSPQQIKRILSVFSMGSDVFDALLLVKRFGRDVKEGKRRQFNYIGRLLREVDAELMDGLIQATKDGDEIKFRELSGTKASSIVGDNSKKKEADYESESESESEINQDQIDLVTKWTDGLINKDVQIMNEIYSMQDVDFDRQELRRLVRKVHSVKENHVTWEEKDEKVGETMTSATRSLNCFLREIVKPLSVE